ncbi:hypothetical protein HNP84_001117 [Thermocatellispora tengchongensis]|uniref:Uncharacterized protein n=1 Tax=Thermocatellispora tengchongensis TaxID=1073253 RepID=A0A840P0I8_9ACTN|nr:hypothetical protein [Thermocatellispora tengchongensis]MBB5131411.1 hypothetical protein [Thermocatellispora tengchongensis]
MNKGYVAIQRRGGYNVFVIDVYWNRALRLATKLPASPDELGLAAPYPPPATGVDRHRARMGLDDSAGN